MIMLKMLKSKGRLLLFAILTLGSLFLLGAAKIDENAKTIAIDENQAIINNLIECNSQLYKNSGVTWREVLHKKPMLMLRIETSE
jgi:hypothetical protein